jgi:hypothetical protein
MVMTPSASVGAADAATHATPLYRSHVDALFQFPLVALRYADVPGPAVKFTAAPSVIACPASVPLTVTMPELSVNGSVSFEVYVPLLLSSMLPSLPAVVFKRTVPPLVVRFVPEASFNCTVIKVDDDPSATIVVGLAEIVDVAVLAGPCANAGTVTTQNKITLRDTAFAVNAIDECFIFFNLSPFIWI